MVTSAKPAAAPTEERDTTGESGRRFLRFLSRWDHDENEVLRAIGELAGRPVSFSGRTPKGDASALFALFERSPLDAVSQQEDGSWVIPYNPWLAYRQIVEERYLKPAKAPLHSRLPFDYHRVPGRLRLALYPLVAGRSSDDGERCPPYPAWPVEDRVDTYRAMLFAGLEGIPIDRALPASWPGGARYPLMVTHDIDTKKGMARAGVVLDEMVALGLKPCFFLVAHGYTWDEGFCDAVRQAGGEIALHGDTHDNRIAFETPERIAQRLDSCRDLLRRQQIVGFRSPSLLVSDALYDAVGARFAWDSSVPDTDTNTLLGPRRGCATVFPFRRRSCLVLPTTMPADDRLLLQGYRGLDMLALLRRKWLAIRKIGGLCHFLTHPEPHLFGRRLLRDLYRALFEEILADEQAWVATPSMVAEWWRGHEKPTTTGAPENGG